MRRVVGPSVMGPTAADVASNSQRLTPYPLLIMSARRARGG